MHELSVAQALVDQVENIVREQHAKSATLIRVRIGALSGVVAELLATAFSLAAAGSVAEAAKLEIVAAPIRVLCLSCGAESDATANRLLCGICGDWHTQVISGDELILESVELEMQLEMKEATEHV